MLAWGVDVAGTDCKVGVVDADGAVRAESEFEDPASPEVAGARDRARCTALAADVGGGTERLGLACPDPPISSAA